MQHKQSGYQYEYRNSKKHRRDRVLRSCIKSFLNSLKNTSRLRWIGSHNVGSTRIESVFQGFNLKLTHIFENPGRKLMIRGNPHHIDRLKEEYRIELKDKFMTYGRVVILDELIDKKDSLFKLVKTVFEELETRASFIDPSTTVDRINIPQCVRGVEKIIESL